jgi:ketosteroid isomerase-like protein
MGHGMAPGLYLCLGLSLGDVMHAQSEDSALFCQGLPAEIAHVMGQQQHAWNNGDLAGFMQGYWESDSLMFVGGDGITWGHAATLARYQAGYPDQRSMGVLSFTNMTWLSLSSDTGLLVGSWHLEKVGLEDASGMYSLVWRRQEGRWLIIADHSS